MDHRIPSEVNAEGSDRQNLAASLAFFIALFGVSSILECNLKSTNHALAIE